MTPSGSGKSYDERNAMRFYDAMGRGFMGTLAEYNLVDKIAITANIYGDGRVFLISPHPEVEEDTNRDGSEPFSEYEDEGSDWPLLYNAIEWLAFLSPFTNTQGAPFPTVFAIIAVVMLVYWSRSDKKNRKLSK